MAQMIRGARLHHHGTLDDVIVEEFEVGDPRDGAVRVRLRTAALNHLDLFVVRGIPGLEIPMPHVLGADGAGTVEAIGGGVHGVAPGDSVVLDPGISCGDCEFCVAGQQSLCVRFRLLGEHVPGTFAESVVVPARNCHPKPEALGWVEAAAFPLAYLTAWRMVVTRGGVRDGDTVLVHGIGGGVSLACAQIAAYSGARVIATSHSDDKLRRATQLGVAETINYTTHDVVREVRRLTDKRGADLVIDNVGEATFAASIDAVCKGGRIVTCGATTGAEVPVNVRKVFWKQIDILGSTMGGEDDFAGMLGAVGSGALVPVVDRVFALDDAVEALARMRDAEQFGKIVLEI